MSDTPRNIPDNFIYDFDMIRTIFRKIGFFLVTLWSRSGPPPPLGGVGKRDRLTVTNLRGGGEKTMVTDIEEKP